MASESGIKWQKCTVPISIAGMKQMVEVMITCDVQR